MENTWMEDDVKKMVKKTNVKFLSQGAYGCVFYPGFTCKGKDQSTKYVSKIEIKKKYAEKEFEIGKFIKKKIRLYRTMFAPILSYCSVDVSKIDTESIRKCDLIQKDDKLLFSTKIRYVGKQSLEPYLYSLLDDNNVSFFIKNMFETHIYLTNSISKLIKHRIVHYDIKENNILYDSHYLLPIIIDFGLSFRIDLLTTEIDYRKAFYIYAPTCIWWCLEITIISYIVCQEYGSTSSSSSWMEDIINVDDLLRIVDYYYTNNNCILLIMETWEKEVNISKKKWKQYIQTEFKHKSGKEIVEILMQSWDSWDLYALSFIFLSFLQNLCGNCLKEYQDFLVEYILSFSRDRERITIKNYYSMISHFSEEYVDLENLSMNRDSYKQKSKVNQLHVSEIESVIY